jgi:hypothetical protein
MRGTVETWVNSQWKYYAAPGQLSVEINTFDYTHYERDGFDALSEFPPHGIRARNSESEFETTNVRTGGRIRRYGEVVAAEAIKPPSNGRVHPGVMPGWDNSARMPTSAVIYHEATPHLFQQWLVAAIQRARSNPAGERFVFINAWNEWAEGAYLEPDLRHGYEFLDACAQSLMQVGLTL